MLDLNDQLLTALLYATPRIVLYLLGALVGILVLRKHFAAGLLTILGCLGLLLLLIISGFVNSYLTTELRTGNLKPERFASINQLIWLISSAAYCLGFGLILVAVAVGRKSSNNGVSHREADTRE